MYLIRQPADELLGTVRLRCNRNQTHQPVCCLLQPQEHLYIRIPDISRILRTLFLHGNKRSFQMNPDQSRPGILLCLRSLCIRIRIGTHRLKRLLRECHRCRADACHALAKLIRADRLQCLRCSVREIMTCTSVKMNVHKPRYQVISPCVQDLFPVRAGRFTPRKTAVFYPDIPLHKSVLYRVYKCILNSHLKSPIFL